MGFSDFVGLAFFSKFYVFKVLALICTFYILYKEFCLFVITKPITTSTEKTKLVETFPNIAICPVAGLNIQEFYANGYNYEYAYFTGYFVGDFHAGKT